VQNRTEQKKHNVEVGHLLTETVVRFLTNDVSFAQVRISAGVSGL
jgi:hypothetical protein